MSRAMPTPESAITAVSTHFAERDGRATETFAGASPPTEASCSRWSVCAFVPMQLGRHWKPNGAICFCTSSTRIGKACPKNEESVKAPSDKEVTEYARHL